MTPDVKMTGLERTKQRLESSRASQCHLPLCNGVTTGFFLQELGCHAYFTVRRWI